MEKTVGVAMIGLGGRGYSLLAPLSQVPGARIAAVCDAWEDRLAKGRDRVEELTGRRPACYTDYRKLLEDPQVDCVIVATSWQTHVTVASEAMRAGKYVGLEVGGAFDLEDCWELVRTHEQTGAHLMFLENCCYGENELTLLNMVKKGMLGELVHCQTGYQHDLRGEITSGRENRHYRFHHFLHRNADLYPTHGLGPVANLLDINRGNRMLTLCSMSSSSKGLPAWIRERAPADSDLRGMDFTQGDVTTTMIRCAHGQTILLIHDVSLPRPYSRGNRIQGTGGIYMEDGSQIFLWDKVKDHCTGAVEEEHRWEPFAPYLEECAHPLWREYKEAGIQQGHGGIDYLTLSALVESASHSAPPPIDVYDAAAWMSITTLSEQSVAMGGHPVPIPDFTRGRWLNRPAQRPSKYALDAVHNELFGK